MGQIVQLPTKPPGSVLSPGVRDMNDFSAEVLFKERHWHAALNTAKRAIRISPNVPELWCNIGTYFYALREYEEALAATDRALALNPNMVKVYANRGLILSYLGRHAEAEESFARGIAIDPGYLGAQWDRGLMRLELGDYPGGFADYETRIAYRREADGTPVYPKYAAPAWKGEPLAGKAIYVAAEQGIGDTILFSRFIPWLAEQAGKIYLNLGSHLVPLFWEFRHMADLLPEGVLIPEADYSVHMGSLPYLAGADLEQLPPDPGLIRKRAEAQFAADGQATLPKVSMDNPFRVGICWGGNPEQDRDHERRIPFELMMGLAEHPNVWVHSLQVGPPQKDIKRCGGDGLVYDLGPQLEKRGLVVAATAIMQMDLVVTCCTSIAHLAGALGKPTWLLVGTHPYWVWMRDRGDSPWYPSIRIFRQETIDDWKTLLAKVQDELVKLVEVRQLTLAS